MVKHNRTFKLPVTIYICWITNKPIISAKKIEWETKHELLMPVYHTHHSGESNNLLQKKTRKTNREQLIPKLYIVNDGPWA